MIPISDITALRPRRLLRSSARGLALVAALATLAPTTAWAIDWELQLSLFNRFGLRRNLVEHQLRFDVPSNAFDVRGYLTPKIDELSYSFVAVAGGYLQLTKWLGAGLILNSGQMRPFGRSARFVTLPISANATGVVGDIYWPSTADDSTFTANGQRVSAEARQSYFIDEAFLRFSATGESDEPWLRIEVGRRAARIANGLIFNDYGLAIDGTLDLELKDIAPLRFGAQLVFPSRNFERGYRSPLVELRVNWVLSFLESVGLLFAYFRDGEDNFSDLYQGWVTELAQGRFTQMSAQDHIDEFAAALSAFPRSVGQIFWFGVRGNKLLGDFLLSGTALLSFGKIELFDMELLSRQLRLTEIELTTLGFAVDLSARYLITDELSIGLWFLMLSGEANPLLAGQTPGNRYGSFISVVPYLTHTNIFFSGGLNETFNGRSSSSSGINARGVIASGLRATWDPKDFELSFNAAALLSDQPSIGRSRFYGVEFDMQARYEVTKWLNLAAEYDVLLPGDFFLEHRVIHQALIGIDFKVGYEG
ncbi:MAG: hypothetical protein H6707_06505 [Deltaproteobacteria bacterium]|nr:hypothetical protein [Deltaproteobacteria bacterium]